MNQVSLPANTADQMHPVYIIDFCPQIANINRNKAGILFFIAPDGMQKRFAALRLAAILPKKAQEIVFPPREQNCILVKKHSAALFFRIKAQPLHRGRLLFDRFTPKHIRFNLGGKSAAHRKQKTFH